MTLKTLISIRRVGIRNKILVMMVNKTNNMRQRNYNLKSFNTIMINIHQEKTYF